MLFACGVNTEEPVYPILTVTTVASPTLLSVQPVEDILLWETPYPEYRIAFDIQYYLTNQEEGFVGYNLYMSTVNISPDDPVSGPYMPQGYEPSFPHVDQNPDTTKAITQRVTHFRPPPGERPFDLCEKYFFRLKATTRSGIESSASPICVRQQPFVGHGDGDGPPAHRRHPHWKFGRHHPASPADFAGSGHCFFRGHPHNHQAFQAAWHTEQATIVSKP